MLLAKCLYRLPNDCCKYIKNILQDENYFFTYNTLKNIILIDADVILSYFNEVYDIVNTLLILFNPKFEIKMHYNENFELPQYIIDDWFYGLNPSKIIMVWEASYFT